MKKTLSLKAILALTSIITSLVIATGVGLTGIYFTKSSINVALKSYENAMNDGYKTEIESQMQAVLSIIEFYYNSSKDGTMTEEDAKFYAKETVRAMRYRDDKSGYFWIDDYDYNLIMHPILPKDEGTNRYEIADKTGTKILQQVIKSCLASDKGVFNQFFFTKADGVTVAPKLAYSDKFSQWRWIISTGNYVDDMNANIEKEQIFMKKNYTTMIAIMIIVTVLLVLAGSVSSIYLEKVVSKYQNSLSHKLHTQIQLLVDSIKKTAATSQDQSAAVKEIVATMEDSNALSNNISTKIEDIKNLTQKTSEDVIKGVESLQENVSHLHDISDANKKTIEGIKELSAKIEKIWEIVSLINSVADQAKIIAFNAELEASNAGETGKNFHIVATEIRRLADGIISGTKEIKESITEIQRSSDVLILTSESGTEKIAEGYETAKDLQDKFTSIKDSAEITANSSIDMNQIIHQQTTASEQILITIKQIASGIENTSNETENLSDSAQNLKSITEELNK